MPKAALLAVVFALSPNSSAEGELDEAIPKTAAHRVLDFDEKLAEARRALDGAAMIEALEGLVALEGVVKTPTGSSAALTKVDDFAEAADLVSDKPDLLRRLMSLTPIRLRGAEGGAMRHTISVAQGMPHIRTIKFKPNDFAAVYVRDAEPGSIRLTVRKPGADDAVRVSAVAKGAPICAWQADEAGLYEVVVESLMSEMQSVQLLIN